MADNDAVNGPAGRVDDARTREMIGTDRKLRAGQPIGRSRLHEWDPDVYIRSREWAPHYDEMHTIVSGETLGRAAKTILDLGIGTGEASRRALFVHKAARVVGVDSSVEMLRAAGEALPHDRVTLIHGDLVDPLPGGPFELVLAVLSIHHLDQAEKKVIFTRIYDVLSTPGRFILGDLVLKEEGPKRPRVERLRVSLHERGAVGTAYRAFEKLWTRGGSGGQQSHDSTGPDKPELLSDLVTWLEDAGFRARVAWQRGSRGVITSDKLPNTVGRAPR